jgi:hypothetical protein
MSNTPMQNKQLPDTELTTDSRPGSAEFEFEGDHQAALALLARTMGSTSASSFALATIGVVVGFMALRGASPGLAVVLFVAALYFGWSGFWMWRAAGEVRAIVDTAGRDQTHLLRAVRRLALYYQTKMWVLLVLVAFTLLSLTGQTLGG